MDLFIQPVQFEKVAAGVALPEDPNAWPKEILDELYKQVPYVASFHPSVVMTNVDAERAYGLGHVEVANQSMAQQGTDPAQLQAAGIRSVRIPIIVKDGRLSPFDLMMNDAGKAIPLTEARLRQAIFRPQMFDVTAQAPGDQNIMGTLYPPYRQNHGFGGAGGAMSAGGSAGMGKTASDFHAFLVPNLEARDAGFRTMHALSASQVPFKKTASILNDLGPTFYKTDLDQFWGAIEQDASLQASLRKTASVHKCLAYLASLRPSPAEKTAAAVARAITPTVTQLTKVAEGYRVKAASHQFWSPLTSIIDRGQLVRQYGEKVAFAVDTAGGATLADGADAVTVEEPQMAPVTAAGTYEVMTDGGETMTGIVIPNLLDLDGTPVPLSLFVSSTAATVQAEIFGNQLEGAGMLEATDIGGSGFFFNEENGEKVALIPMTLQSSVTMPGASREFMGETYDGRPILVSAQPNIKIPTSLGDGRLIVPEGWKWSSLERAAHVTLAGGPDHVQEPKTASVKVRGYGTTFSFFGAPVEKLARDQRESLDVDGAMFLLAGLGVDQTHGLKKLAHSLHGEATVSVGRSLALASEVGAWAMNQAREKRAAVQGIKVDLKKEATQIADPLAVDTVLSLGFLNEENILSFVSYLPTIDDAQMKLCETLLAVRLGLPGISESAIERAVRSVEQVIENLKTIAFT